MSSEGKKYNYIFKRSFPGKLKIYVVHLHNKPMAAVDPELLLTGPLGRYVVHSLK
jgi:hypothetical protein